MVVGPGMKTGVRIFFDTPKEVGADQIANAVAAYDQYKSAMVLVDFGTATTFSAISASGDYLGGCISPGLKLSADVLSQRAAKLNKIELQYPPSVLGRNNASCMQAGILYGYVGLTDYLVNKLKAELQGPVVVVATGGLAAMIAEKSETIDHVEPYLSLNGLCLLYKRNLVK